MKIKDKAINTANSTKRIVLNAEQFVQAAALLSVAGFSYWALGRVEVQKSVYWAVLASLVIIGMRGAYEMVRFLDKKGE